MQHVFLRFQSNETQGAVVFCGQDKTNRRDRLPLIPMILCDLEVPRAGAPSPIWCLSLDYEQSPFSSGIVERPKRERARKSPHTSSLPAACRLFSRGVIFTRARVSLALLSLRKTGDYSQSRPDSPSSQAIISDSFDFSALSFVD